MKPIILALAIAVPTGAAALGYVALADRSALPAWIPTSFADVMPDRLVLPHWVPASWSEAASRMGLSDPPAPAPVSSAGLDDYAFELVQPQVKQGDGATVAVRLIHRPTGEAVPDAVIFARRIDMEPEGMATMTAPLEPIPGGDPGTYRFKTNLIMQGGWRLSLAAKVQGETGTVQSRLVLKAVP